MQSHNGAGCFAVVIQEINDGLESPAGLVDVYAFGNGHALRVAFHVQERRRMWAGIES